MCETYWFPLYAYLRRRGYDRHRAEDYTQAFFTGLLERQGIGKADPKKGKFRSFILASLKHFLADEWDHTQAKKRGAAIKVLPLDIDDGETRYSREPVDDISPERLFERSWAQAILKQAMAQLKAEFVSANKQRLFEHLKTCLTVEQGSIPYSSVAAKLNMTEGAIKTAVYRLKKRYGELVRDQIAQTVATKEQIEEELRELYSALAD